MSPNEQLEAVRKEMHEWRQLKDLPAYVRMCEGIDGQLRGRRAALDDLRPASLDALISLGASVSEMAGMRLVIGWPDIMLNELRLKERQLLEMINEH